ncbi:MAG: hypothetical protein SNJ82_00410 [Gemmataceae bacterium]
MIAVFWMLCATEVPTYSQEVAPILYTHCASCHREGEAGPFPLLSYADARKRAKLIARVVGEKSMPPWMPEAPAGTFHDERKLTAAQIDTLQRWAKAGAPEGDPKNAPAVPHFKTGWQLSTPDLVVKMAKPFEIPAEGRDIYWHFVFPLNLTKEKYLCGVEIRPSNRRVAHHAVGILDTSGTARKLNANNKGNGYPGYSPGFLPAGFIPSYAPGMTPRFFDKDTTIVLKPGTDLVLQMHYHPTGKVETDQTEIGLYFTERKPAKGPVIIAMASEEIDIPAGERKYRATDRFKLPVDMQVRNIWAHMHTIGKTVRVTATLPNGTKRQLLHIPDWDFNWQDTYLYREPFVLPKGTIVDAEWTWDNSADNPRNPFSPPRRIRLGEDSTDEMSGLIIGGIANHWVDELAHWGAVIGHYFEVTKKGQKYKRKS